MAALALNDPPVTVNGSSFTGNTSSGSGGAIASSAVLTVNNGAFTGNSAGESGGAIASGNALVVNGPSFTGNHAGALGGALELLGDGPTIVGTFSGNTADGAGPVAYWAGRSTLIIEGVDPADIDAPFAARVRATPDDSAHYDNNDNHRSGDATVDAVDVDAAWRRHYDNLDGG